MKRININTNILGIIAGIVLLARVSSLNASHTSSSRSFTEQQLQGRLLALAQQTQTLSSRADTSTVNTTQSTSSASSAIAPDLHSPITASTSCSTDGSEILDTLYLNQKHPSKYQYPLARTLYAALSDFPSELITLIMTYIKLDTRITCSQELYEHEMCVRILLPISPTKFASADQFGIIKIWELNTGTWKCITTIDTEPYNKKHTITALAPLNEDWLISGAANGQIILWYLANNRPVHIIENDRTVNALAPLSDKSFASGTTSISKSPQQSAIILWRKTYQHNNQQTVTSWDKQQTLPTENNPLFLIKLVRKERLCLACGFSNGDVNLYRGDKQNWALSKGFRPHTASPLQAMAHNPANNSLICAYKTRIFILDSSLKPLRKLDPIDDTREKKLRISTCLPWKNAEIIVGISDDTSSQILFFEENAQHRFKERTAIEAYDEPISNLIAPNDKQLISAGRTHPSIRVLEYPYENSNPVNSNQSTTCVML